MMLSARELETRFLLLKSRVIEAGIRVKSMRDQNKISIEQKPDGSFVTNADKWANEFLVNFIKSELGDNVIGEESADKSYAKGTDLIWYIDPIDGTSAYAKGGKDYFVLAGLCVDGIPVLGIHYQPETGKVIYGWQGKQPHLQLPGKLPVALSNISTWNENNRVYIKTNDLPLRQQVLDLGVNKAVYARGMVDMISPLFERSEGYISYRTTHFWDIAAPAAIVKSAGFKLYSNIEEPIFNSGQIKTPFFYALPPNTPDSFIDHISDIHKKRIPLW